MKYYKSKIGEYGVRWEPVEGYKRKDGTYVPPHMRRVKYQWKQKQAS
jgi:hypothetical protein